MLWAFSLLGGEPYFHFCTVHNHPKNSLLLCWLEIFPSLTPNLISGRGTVHSISDLYGPMIRSSMLLLQSSASLGLLVELSVILWKFLDLVQPQTLRLTFHTVFSPIEISGTSERRGELGCASKFYHVISLVCHYFLNPPSWSVCMACGHLTFYMGRNLFFFFFGLTKYGPTPIFSRGTHLFWLPHLLSSSYYW